MSHKICFAKLPALLLGTPICYVDIQLFFLSDSIYASENEAE